MVEHTFSIVQGEALGFIPGTTKKGSVKVSCMTVHAHYLKPCPCQSDLSVCGVKFFGAT